MDKIRVKGGRPLYGSVHTGGAKNSALPLLFSTLLAPGEHRFENVPFLKDIDSTQSLLQELGAEVFRDGTDLVIQTRPEQKFSASYDLVRKMRASILCLGPLLARFGQAIVSLPGGCAIGTRPIDQHLEAMKSLGAEIETKSGYVHASTEKLVGSNILFDGVTVGGTENALMAAVLAEGETVIENAAKEPEIVDLANYLVKMGAKIEGAGSSLIRVQGVKELVPTRHRVMPDRIEAGTLLIAGAITGGSVTVKDCVPLHLEALIQKMREAGFAIEVGVDSVSVREQKRWRAVDISTSPYPGFPTDLQAQFMVLMTQAEGTSVIAETIFENRFMHVQELMRLNADITPKTRVAVVRGAPGDLMGAPVMATDLRASACLVLAGLVAGGETMVNRIYHLDRGYEKLEEKLSQLGADIERLKA